MPRPRWPSDERVAARDARAPHGTIYVISCHGYIKVGFTRKVDPWRRIKELQCGNPHRFDRVFFFRGEYADEKELHARLRLLPAGGEDSPTGGREWFIGSPLVAEEIARWANQRSSAANPVLDAEVPTTSPATATATPTASGWAAATTSTGPESPVRKTPKEWQEGV